VDNDRREQNVPEVTMPLEETLEPGQFIKAGSDFPNIHTAAGEKDQ
jgi:hypothetical protein